MDLLPEEPIEPVRPVDRDEFSEEVPIDPETRRTERRIERLRHVLERRQDDLTVVLENVHDPHNLSAVLRTCDAVGVGTVHLLYTREEFPAPGHSSSAGVAKWIDFVRHESVNEAVDVLKESGFRILATTLGEQSTGLFEVNLVQPVAIVFGNEHRGVSDEMIAACDERLRIPMVGFVESLNISVACAVTMYEAMRQRLSMGSYRVRKSTPEFERKLLEWAKL